MELKELLSYAIQQNASDVHLASGTAPIIRVAGDLQTLTFAKLTEADILMNITPYLKPNQNALFLTQHQVDFAFTLENTYRLRANLFRQYYGVSLAIRIISNQIPLLTDFNTQTILRNLLLAQNGLIIVAGPTGSGKSTTLAALINTIHQEQNKHIITFEDPIEFIYPAGKSLIQQRELGLHSVDFASALTAALRQDPDILVLGELRDATAIRLALTAAETGHLVFASLHTASAAKTIHRIIDVFAAEEKNTIRSMLATSLTAIISQRLVAKNPEGRIAVQEIMQNNYAIQNLIKEDKIVHIYSVIQTQQQAGMQTLEQHLSLLLNQGIIMRDDALSIANHKELIL